MYCAFPVQISTIACVKTPLKTLFSYSTAVEYHLIRLELNTAGLGHFSPLPTQSHARSVLHEVEEASSLKVGAYGGCCYQLFHCII
jgi:hypothetical protein